MAFVVPLLSLEDGSGMAFVVLFPSVEDGVLHGFCSAPFFLSRMDLA